MPGRLFFTSYSVLVLRPNDESGFSQSDVQCHNREMHVSVKLFLFVAIFILSRHAQAQVVIDPGHGGKDGGTFWGHLKESDITLDLAERLETALHAAGIRETKLTRDHDEFLALVDRVKETATSRKTFFLSLHVNSHPSSRVHGFEIYSAFPQTNAVATSSPLSYILQDIKKKGRVELENKWEEDVEHLWHAEFPNETFRVKQAPFYVLEHSHAPSLLIEIGFLTNADDRVKFKDRAFGDRLVRVLAEAVAEMWTLEPEPPTLAEHKPEDQPMESKHAPYRWANASGPETDSIHALSR